MALAAAGALEDLCPFILGDHALKLQQELVLRGGRRRRLDEPRLDAMAGEFLGEQHLIGLLATETVR